MSKILPVLMFALLASACAAPAIKEVYVPVACNVPDTQRPKQTHNTAQDFKNILIYTHTIENDLNFCKGKNNVK